MSRLFDTQAFYQAEIQGSELAEGFLEYRIRATGGFGGEALSESPAAGRIPTKRPDLVVPQPHFRPVQRPSPTSDIVLRFNLDLTVTCVRTAPAGLRNRRQSCRRGMTQWEHSNRLS